MVQIKSQKEIALMIKAGELAAEALELAGKSIAPGISTWEIDRIVHDFIVSRGGKTPCEGYCGFPGCNCVSINEELIHGIPSKTKIVKDGDIVSVDIVAELNGYMGDNTKTFRVGRIAEETERLLQVTEQALYEGISKAVAGNRIGDISNAVQTHVEKNGFYIVRRYIGHGIGREMHEDPEVPNFGRAGHGVRLVPGMAIAIEPMINQSTEEVKVLKDNWTVVEGNGKMSAHFEHTVLITDGEPLILTLSSH